MVGRSCGRAVVWSGGRVVVGPCLDRCSTWARVQVFLSHRLYWGQYPDERVQPKSRSGFSRQKSRALLPRAQQFPVAPIVPAHSGIRFDPQFCLSYFFAAAKISSASTPALFVAAEAPDSSPVPVSAWAYFDHV